METTATADLLEACKQIIWKLSHNSCLPDYEGPGRITRNDATVKLAVAAVAKAESEVAARPDLLAVCKAIAALADGQGRKNLPEVAGQARRAIAESEKRMTELIDFWASRDRRRN